MRNISKVIQDSMELPITIYINMPNGKRLQRVAGVQKVSDDMYVGHITKRKKVTGLWWWLQDSQKAPVFYSQIMKDKKTGQPVILKKGPLIDALKRMVLSIQDSGKPEKKKAGRPKRVQKAAEEAMEIPLPFYDEWEEERHENVGA